MSVARPSSRRLLSRLASSRPPKSQLQLPLISLAIPRPPCHHHALHSSAPLSARRKPRFKNVLAEEMGLTAPADMDKYTKDHFPEYTAEEKAVLAQFYTPEQMAALEAGEATIDRRDLTLQGRLRTDSPLQLPYVDDFRAIKPVIDFRPHDEPLPTRSTDFMPPDAFAEDTIAWALGNESLDPKGGMSEEELMKKLDGLAVSARLDAEEAPEGADAAAGWGGKGQAEKRAADPDQAAREDEKRAQHDLELEKWWNERESLLGTGGTGNTRTAPELGDDIAGVTEFYKTQADEKADQGLDEEGTYTELKQRTGMSLASIMNTSTKVLVVRFVHNQTRLGKIRRASVLAVAGNRDGRIGLGVAKSTDPQAAFEMAKIDAIENMKPIVRYENRTIFGNARAKISGTVVELYSRPPGFGLRVPPRLFEICRICGISDLTARIPRSRNPMNTVKATIQALQNQINPEDIAIGRGKKMVDVRKVYYGGAVY